MLRSPRQCLRQSLPYLAAFGAFLGCGGAADSGLFGSAGRGSSAGASSQAGQPGISGGSAMAGSFSSAGVASSAGAPSSAGAAGASAGAAGTATGGSGTGGSGAGGSGAGGSGAAGKGAGGSTPSAGSGGASGGGNAGAGGRGGNGGTSGAGSAGSAGGGGTLSCAELNQQATQRLQAAQACNLAMSATPCTGRVMSICGCELPVHRAETAETKAYLETLAQLQAQDCVQVCPAVECSPVKNAMCTVTMPGSIMGRCSAGFLGAL